ncbi:MAG: thiol reductase thioredoxin [Flavobacteriia bacterium]|nr:MAG: thiol reductase thioredoxin [Flavobacteriia bacterium]
MSKFGDIIGSDIPVLIDFYHFTAQEDIESKVMNTLKDVATTFMGKARVVKIDIGKNAELVKALRIKTSPTYIVYKNNEMLWRQSGSMDAQALIDILNEFVV